MKSAKNLNNSFFGQPLPDRAIQSDELPWIPYGEQIWIKPLRIDLASGQFINLLKATRGGIVNRHRHTGGQVLGYCIQGSWHYLERTWVARPGTFLYEPPGDVHTLVVDQEGGEMVTLFVIEGSVQYLDEENNMIDQDDVFKLQKLYLDYCNEHGMTPQDLHY